MMLSRNNKNIALLFCITKYTFAFYVTASDGVKDTDGKAKAKDIRHEAKTKAKDLTL